MSLSPNRTELAYAEDGSRLVAQRVGRSSARGCRKMSVLPSRSLPPRLGAQFHPYPSRDGRYVICPSDDTGRFEVFATAVMSVAYNLELLS